LAHNNLMKFLNLTVPESSATYTKSGKFFRIVDVAKVYTQEPGIEAESESALVQSLGLEPYTPAPPEAMPAPKAPSVIANWRAKAVLSLEGLLPAVEAAINALPDPDKTVALAAWNGGADLNRSGPTVTAAIAALKLTKKQVDDLFIQAAALKV